jgi:hypothetical protein
MSYTINLTNGSLFAVIPDGTINQATNLTLVGKNYAGYGQFLDENFVYLLENASNTTAPPAPLTGQLWWDSANKLLKVYDGAIFKTISAATSSASAPTSNSIGDLWFDTTNQQLKVWTGSAWLLIGPAFTAGTGTTGAIPDTILDNTNVSHVVIKLYVNNNVVGIVSKDAAFTPQTPISGFAGGVLPGITLASTISAVPQLFQGTATNAQALGGYSSSSFLLKNVNETTTGTFGVLNNSGLSVGFNQDFKVSVNGANVTLANQTSNGNINFSANIAGTPTTVMTINGSTGVVSGNQITANYADVAERFAADVEMIPGTVVELGVEAEVTEVQQELSDNVFGVISTRAAYLMNSQAGTDQTHPPIAMTGRVPVRVVGIVRKGDRLVSAGNGLARAAQPGEATAFNVIGRSLAHKTDTAEGTVEAIVTIK